MPFRRLPHKVQPNELRTPLHRAVIAGDVRQVKALLRSGVDPTEPAPDDWASNSALHIACLRPPAGTCRVIIEILLGHGADINARNTTGETPFHFALSACDAGVVRFLLELPELDVAAISGRGRQTIGGAFHYAAWNRRFNAVELLLQHPVSARLQLNLNCAWMSTALHWTVDPANCKAARSLLSAGINPKLQLTNESHLGYCDFSWKTFIEEWALEIVQERDGLIDMLDILFMKYNPQVRLIFGVCFLVIRKLRTCKTDGTVSFFDVLVASDDKIQDYAGNRQISEAVRTMSTRVDCEYMSSVSYGERLESRYREARVRLRRRKAAAKFLVEALVKRDDHDDRQDQEPDRKLPTLVIHRITNYLEEDELIRLARIGRHQAK